MDEMSQSEAFPLALAACCDDDHRVRSAGESVRKRLHRSDLENPSVVSALYRLCLGSAPSAAAASQPQQAPSTAATKRSGAKASIRILAVQSLSSSAAGASSFSSNIQVKMTSGRCFFFGVACEGSLNFPSSSSRKREEMRRRIPVSLLSFLSSTDWCNCHPKKTQLVFECVFGTSSTGKLKVAGMTFAHQMLRHIAAPALVSVAPVLLSVSDGMNNWALCFFF